MQLNYACYYFGTTNTGDSGRYETKMKILVGRDEEGAGLVVGDSRVNKNEVKIMIFLQT